MKTIYILCSAFMFVSLIYYCNAGKSQELPTKKKGTSLEGNKKKPEKEPQFGSIKASDETLLSYAYYRPQGPQAILIFYHGSGAHGCAGYTYMAEQICNSYNIATYLFDMRGHGKSGGARGATPSPEQVWSDVRSAMEHMKAMHPEVPVFLGGHSGGAGMLLNYAHWSGHTNPAGYMLVTPFLGKDVNIFRERKKKHERSFATIHFASLIINKLTCGLIGGDWIAMTMQYPEHYVTELGFVNAYTVNMINALNSQVPLKTLEKILVETVIFIADQDELFDPQKLDQVLADVASANSLVTIEHLPQAKHLTILGEAHDYIGTMIQNAL